LISTSASFRYRFGRFELQPEERRLLADGVVLRVGGHALDLLLVFVERSGHLVSKDELLTRVWHGVVVEENTLQSHIAALRKVVGAGAIATVSGRGYRFVSDVERVEKSSADGGPMRQDNLPHQLTSFIGREKEIEQITRLLASTRLMTLIGAGGCGKTRLALQVASKMRDAYPDGTWLVEFAPLAEPTLLPQTVANALAIKEQGGKDITETVAEWLGPRHLLCVMDNTEHLLEECARFTDLLLRRCARLTILVTSRERLAIAGELTYRVPSLSVPDEQSNTTRESALACEAARLFIERARLQRPDLEITDRDIAPLCSICRRLDGIALAIELAAPRVRAMSLQELSRLLDDRFGVLTDGSRVGLPRHRTLRSLIDWSYDLLGNSEKTMLWRSSVFAGGWTLEAAEHICGDGNVSRGEILDLLTSLADKNLITVDAHEETTRFGMLETVRHYGQDRLLESGEETAVRARHLEYFVELADGLAAPQKDAERQSRLERMGKEHDNLRAALAWCETATFNSARGLRLAGDLFWFWRVRGQLGEGRNWIARLLAAEPRGELGEDHARAFRAAGTLAYFQDDYAAAETHHRDALAIWRRLGHRMRVASTLGNLGNVALNRGDHAGARNLMEQALALAREDGDKRHIAIGLGNLGTLAHDMGDLGVARALLEECVSLSRQFGRWSAGAALARLGRVRHSQGDPEAARNLLTEALEGQQQFEDRQSIAMTLVWLGAACHDCGDISTAKQQLQEALTIQQAVGDRINMAAALDAFAGLSVEFASPSVASWVWGRAQSLRDEIGSRQCIPERDRHRRQVLAARSALNDDAAFDLAWNEGRSSTLGEVVQYVVNL
jgi:predicted ATPase/DNA-binding winged helix-turn-helix (wHTH) protein